MSQVNMISECYVRPQKEVEESKRLYYLNSVDLSLLLISYTKCGHVFPKPQNFDALSFVENLKKGLSIALLHFYPFAGQLVTQRSENEHSSCIFIDCHKGSGAKLTHALATHVTVHDILSPNTDVPSVVQSLFDIGWDLINYDGHNHPLLSIQITELKDGVFIGTSTNHCVADGTSCINFLKLWSEMSKSSSLISNNNYAPKFQYGFEPTKLPYVDPDEYIIRLPNSHVRERMFHFSSTSIAMLKSKANAQALDAQISSLQALSALVWRCVARARNLSSKEMTRCGVYANLRPRFQPPLSDDYFGNIVTSVKVIAQVGELLSNNLGWAASLLNSAVMGLDDNMARKVFDGSPKLLLPGLGSSGPNPVSIVGSPRFDFYGAEFGLGKALGIRMGYENEDGLVVVYPGAKHEGSLDLQIRLGSHTMTALLADHEFMSFVSVPNLV